MQNIVSPVEGAFPRTFPNNLADDPIKLCPQHALMGNTASCGGLECDWRERKLRKRIHQI